MSYISQTTQEKAKNSYHWYALVWTGTSGRYFLYGRLRDIISTEPNSSRMLTYCGWNKEQTVFYIYIIQAPFSYTELNPSFWQLLFTCGLLSSTATSGRLTTRSTFGEEKSTSERGFIRSFALADIGRKTGKAKRERSHDKSEDYIQEKINYTSSHSLNW